MDWHPHGHLLATDGGFREDGTFQNLDSWDGETLMRLFRERLLARLVDKHAISRELVAKLLAWRHPGFSAFVGDPIPPENTKAMELSEARVVYHLNVRNFGRLILQRRDVSRDPSLFSVEVEPETKDLFVQFLASYKLNPRTVVFLGYSDNRQGRRDLSLTQTDRTFFFKLGYAWTM